MQKYLLVVKSTTHIHFCMHKSIYTFSSVTHKSGICTLTQINARQSSLFLWSNALGYYCYWNLKKKVFAYLLVIRSLGNIFIKGF